MEPANQIGFYQLENLIMQRVNFTLVDLTQNTDLLSLFGHLNPYYLNFFKNLIHKTTPTGYKNLPILGSLTKESPIIFICDTGAESKNIADELEAEKYINSFYIKDGAKNLRPSDS